MAYDANRNYCSPLTEIPRRRAYFRTYKPFQPLFSILRSLASRLACLDDPGIFLVFGLGTPFFIPQPSDIVEPDAEQSQNRLALTLEINAILQLPLVFRDPAFTEWDLEYLRGLENVIDVNTSTSELFERNKKIGFYFGCNTPADFELNFLRVKLPKNFLIRRHDILMEGMEGFLGSFQQMLSNARSRNWITNMLPLWKEYRNSELYERVDLMNVEDLEGLGDLNLFVKGPEPQQDLSGTDSAVVSSLD